MQTILIDFFYVDPGPFVSERCAKKIFERLEGLNILHRLLASVCDNGSDALKAAKLVSDMISEKL